MMLALIAAVVIGTWNGNWFPSGRAEHRAHPDVEAATTTAAAKMLRSGIDALDPVGTNDIILVLNEMRGPRSASNLVAQIGRAGLRVAVISGYRRRDRFDMQQDVIATTLPIANVRWSRFKDFKKETAPRGYAFAALVLEPAVTANVYAVHLKSNYGAGNDAEKQRLNTAKRTHAVQQIIEENKPKRGEKAKPVVIAGDLNADRWDAKPEAWFAELESAGFATPLALLPDGKRATHPNKKWGDSTLDYIYMRGLQATDKTVIVPNLALSDHEAVFTVIDFSGRDGLGAVRGRAGYPPSEASFAKQSGYRGARPSHEVP